MNTALASLAAFVLLASSAARGAGAPAMQPDRQEIQAMMIDAGYSGVASLHLVQNRWIGVGAHHGTMVMFTVDAATGRILSEVEAR